MTRQDLEAIVQTLDRLTTGEKLALIERLARSLQEPMARDQASPAQQREALQRLCRTLKALPIYNPADGFSNRDHDRVLYGAP